MKKKKYISFSELKNISFPVIIEKGDDGFYTVECSLFQGCYSQGKTIDSALKNIREVIELCLDEEENQKILHTYTPHEVSLHTIRFDSH